MLLTTACRARAYALVFLLFISGGLFAQTVITGRVINNADKQPVAGATVQVKGSKVATQSGTDGTFTLTSNKAVSTLVITVVGFNPETVDVSGRAVLGDIGLSISTTSLNDVVVTGYTSQKKKDITGSVAVVNVANMKSVPSGSTQSLLQGQASGVTVINSGMPGGGSNVRIRGITSLGSSNPLYIVDGVQSLNGMQDINPSDIESIQVLKDAGATAIFGVQGSNGVIVITTRKGHSGKTHISYDGYVGTVRPLSGNPFHLANTPEYAQAIWDMETNSGVTGANHTAQFGSGASPSIPDFIKPEGAHTGDPGTTLADYDLAAGKQIIAASKTGTDWFHEVFKPATIQSHTVSATGGGDRSSYYFSTNYLDQQGTLLNTYLKRYSARMNTVFNVKDNVRIGENAYVFYKVNPNIGNQNEGNSISHIYRIPPIIPVYDIAGNFAGTQAPHLSNSENPVARQVRQKDNKNNDWQVSGNVFAEVDFLKHFTAKTSLGGTFDNYYYYYFNYTAYENAEGNTNANSFTEGAGYNSQWLWTNTVSYANTFGKHDVKLLIGQEANKLYERSFQAGRTNYFLTDPNYWTLNTGDPGGVSNTGGSPTERHLSSYFGRLDYNYDDKYILSGTLRRDASSVFAPGQQVGYFPSISAGWRISRESFFSNVSFVNDLKIRGGWGKAGSISNINPTNAYTLFASGVGYSWYPLAGDPNSSTQGFYPSQIGNINTTWEQDVTSNIGLDALILNNKVEFSVDWYKKEIKGLLFRPDNSLGAMAGGATPAFINGGNIENKGIDASVSYHATISQDFKLDISANVTSYKCKVVRLPGDKIFYADFSAGSSRIGAFSRAQVGQPIGAFFGYKVIGLFQSADDVNKSPTQDAAKAGRFKYADINNDGKISDSDRTFFGNPNPKFTYGFTLNATYKNLDLSIFLYGSAGNDVINYVKYWTDFPQVFRGNVSKDAVYNSWTPSNPNAKVPILETNGNFSNSGVFNSYYMENGSYLRCKSLSIGYTVAPAMLKNIGVDKLRVYLQAANLFTITKYTGLDPELQGSDLGNNSNFGIDFGNYPANQKNYNIGVSLTF
jgi:TonB-linked SusC/RagA family outer membrane protein